VGITVMSVGISMVMSVGISMVMSVGISMVMIQFMRMIISMIARLRVLYDYECQYSALSMSTSISTSTNICFG
jgi:hypothetical protein